MSAEDLPLNNDGDKERWGIPEGWSEVLNLPVKTIKDRMEISEGDQHLDGNGRMRIFYAESYVREQLKDVLEMSIAQRGGGFMRKGELHGHKKFWSDYLEESFKMEKGCISILLNQYGEGVTGITHAGTIRDEAYFPESQVMNIVEAIPMADKEKCLRQGDNYYWTIHSSPDDYRDRFDFQYDEIVIAKSPSGKARIYYLEEAVERVKGYNPHKFEEEMLLATERRIKMNEAERLAPQFDLKRQYMRCDRKTVESMTITEANNIESMVAIAIDTHPTSADFLTFRNSILRFRIGSWQRFAKVFGYNGDPNEDFILRLKIAERIYGKEDPFVITKTLETYELLKYPHEELGEVALQWADDIRAKAVNSEIWFNCAEQLAKKHYRISDTALHKFAKRVGYSAGRLKHPEVRMIIGFILYGTNDQFLFSRIEQYESLNLLIRGRFFNVPKKDPEIRHDATGEIIDPSADFVISPFAPESQKAPFWLKQLRQRLIDSKTAQE